MAPLVLSWAMKLHTASMRMVETITLILHDNVHKFLVTNITINYLFYFLFIHLFSRIKSKGSEYDENGNIRRWWTKASLDNFVKRSKCLIEQYNNVTIFGYQVCKESRNIDPSALHAGTNFRKVSYKGLCILIQHYVLRLTALRHYQKILLITEA